MGADLSDFGRHEIVAERVGLLGPSWSQALRARHAKARVVKNCSRQFFRTRLFMFVGSNPTLFCGVSSYGGRPIGLWMPLLMAERVGFEPTNTR